MHAATQPAAKITIKIVGIVVLAIKAMRFMFIPSVKNLQTTKYPNTAKRRK
jgi:hypothetical protein